MDSVEATLSQWCPVPDSHLAMYAIFMTNGNVPFTVRDLQGLWDEWRQSDLASHAARQIRGAQHPLRQFGAPTANGYAAQWIPEREKFYNLFRQFITLNQQKTTASLFLIYPDGQELHWNPAGSQQFHSNRGPQLVQVLKVLRQPGDMGLAVTVQYAYKDDPQLYAVPQTRALDQGYHKALLEAISRSPLLSKLQPPLLPTLTNEPLPLEVWRDFWTYFRNRSMSLVSRYGRVPEQLSPAWAKFQGLFQNKDTSIQDFFERIAEVNSQVPADKLLMASFMYDAGFQYALVRLTPALAQLGGKNDMWDWIKLPSTPGTQLIATKAPIGSRMVTKGLYLEQ